VNNKRKGGFIHVTKEKTETSLKWIGFITIFFILTGALFCRIQAEVDEILGAMQSRKGDVDWPR